MANPNVQAAKQLLESFKVLGLTKVGIAPGSRSTPLVIAAVQHGFDITVCHDERSLGFWAVGAAKALQAPVAIVVTSGTAVANLHPAVLEAFNSNTPLLVLTADRPMELRDRGANQTANQVNIFQNSVRWFTDIAAVDAATQQGFLERIARQAWMVAMDAQGPVHLNVMFREPLFDYEDISCGSEPMVSACNNFLCGPRSSPCPKGAPGRSLPHKKLLQADTSLALQEGAGIISGTENGLVLVGQVPVCSREEVHDFIAQLGWPTFAEVHSGFRGSKHNVMLGQLPQMLKKDVLPEFDVVVQIGTHIVSKPVNEMLKRRRGKPHILFYQTENWHDPELSVTHHIRADINESLTWLRDNISTRTMDFRHFKQLNTSMEQLTHRVLEDTPLCDSFVSSAISSMLPLGHSLFVGNSMPIRDMNRFFVKRDDIVDVVVNRGVSGIDGNIATVVGYAQSSEKPITALIGDQTFLHDAGSLALLKNVVTPVTIVVNNNQGGGIFSLLAIGQHRELLNPYFTASHCWDLSGVCRTYDIRHIRVENKEQFCKAYQESVLGNSHTVIEVITNIDANKEFYNRLDNILLNENFV